MNVLGSKGEEPDGKSPFIAFIGLKNWFEIFAFRYHNSYQRDFLHESNHPHKSLVDFLIVYADETLSVWDIFACL